MPDTPVPPQADEVLLRAADVSKEDAFGAEGSIEEPPNKIGGGIPASESPSLTPTPSSDISQSERQARKGDTSSDRIIEKLRTDWPNFPTSAMGMTETVDGKLRWLARRNGETHQHAEDLAERLRKGELVQFDSAEQQSTAIELAKAMNAKDAALKSEKEGEVVTAEPVEFESLGEDERKRMVGEMLAGKYDGGLRSQKNPAASGLMTEILHNLARNESWTPQKREKFVQSMSRLVPQEPPGQQGKSQQSKRDRKPKKQAA